MQAHAMSPRQDEKVRSFCGSPRPTRVLSGGDSNFRLALAISREDRCRSSVSAGDRQLSGISSRRSWVVDSRIVFASKWRRGGRTRSRIAFTSVRYLHAASVRREASTAPPARG
jgi:hypothetical protein